MKTFILYYQDGHVEEVQAETIQEAILGKEHLSYYEDPERDAETKAKLEAWQKQQKDEQVEIAIVPRVVKVPSATEQGKFYDVIIQPNSYIWCPCTGFANRHYCWHSNYVKELLEEEKKNAKPS